MPQTVRKPGPLNLLIRPRLACRPAATRRLKAWRLAT